MCSPNPMESEIHGQVHAWCQKIGAHLQSKTTAYHEIWLGGEKVVDSRGDDEPLYGPTYLPRKFKVNIAIPPINDVDVLAHDLGLIAIVDKGRLEGFDVTVGGGMGMSAGNKATYPNLAQGIGFCRPEQVVDLAEKVLTVQRDFGDRTNRKHARLKYTIDDRGLEWFRTELQRRLGWELEPERPYTFAHHGDRYGWVSGSDGNWHLTLFIENGRVCDSEEASVLTGLRRIAEVHDGEFRLTPNQHLIISRISPNNRPRIERLVRQYGLSDGSRESAIRRNASACVGLPTCGLAMGESERYLPVFLGKLEKVLADAGLADDEIVLRMTGCPNGCARPYVAEIALVAKGHEKYDLYLGADFAGTRLNKLYKASLTEPEILETLTPLFARYAAERQPGEHFGDFTIRAGYVRAVTAGREFHA
jgi:sulfite reductase (NADPH) hemoprotein beta-component